MAVVGASIKTSIKTLLASAPLSARSSLRNERSSPSFRCLSRLTNHRRVSLALMDMRINLVETDLNRNKNPVCDINTQPAAIHSLNRRVNDETVRASEAKSA